MKEDVLKEFNRIKNLKQYKGVSDQKLEQVAQRIVDLSYLCQMYGVDSEEEKPIASGLLDKYLDEYEFETVAEKELLYRLIYFRIIDYRLKKILNKEYSDKEVKSIPGRDLESLYNNEKQILTIEKELGISKAEREKSQNEVVKTQEIKKRKFREWINRPENKTNYTYQCPHCLKWTLVRRRLDKEKDVVLKHPFFVKGGITFNQEMWSWLEKGIITEEQLSKALGGVDPEYFSWIRKHYKLEHNKND